MHVRRGKGARSVSSIELWVAVLAQAEGRAAFLVCVEGIMIRCVKLVTIDTVVGRV